MTKFPIHLDEKKSDFHDMEFITWLPFIWKAWLRDVIRKHCISVSFCPFERGDQLFPACDGLMAFLRKQSQSREWDV